MSNSGMDAVTVPLKYPTSLVFMDESGSPGMGKHFVMAAVKVRAPGKLLRAITDIRDRHAFTGEFKFSKITRGSLVACYSLIDELERSDAHIAACVVDPRVHDPFRRGEAPWRLHARVATQLLVGCINQRELVSVQLDGVTTPRGCALDDTIRGMVNNRLKATSVVTACCGDSRWSDGLQVADLVAGAIASERRQARAAPIGNKTKVAKHLATAFGLTSLADVRTDRVNIATYGGNRRKPRLRMVNKDAQAS